MSDDGTNVQACLYIIILLYKNEEQGWFSVHITSINRKVDPGVNSICWLILLGFFSDLGGFFFRFFLPVLHSVDLT